MEFRFKKEKTEEVRRAEYEKIHKRYPDKIPLICEKDPKCNMKSIEKTKYLIPGDLAVAQFSSMIRKKLEIEKEKAFFLLINGKHSITGDTLMSELYDKYKDNEDGFLYISYSSELTWGYKNKNNKIKYRL
jgi:GABA(A) receptor-associated protein